MESIAALLFAVETPMNWPGIITLVVVFAALVLPFVIGAMIARSLRMRDYGWKFGLILCATALSCVVIGRTWDPVNKRFNIKLGVDLQGGVILIYEVEKSVKFTDDTSAKGRRDKATTAPTTDVADFSMSALIEALSRRINPSGTKEIVIRPYGDRQVEIIIPEVDQVEVDQIKKTISTAGVLQFRIVANSRDHADIIDLAREAANDPIKKRGRVIFDESGNAVGLWARVGRETKEVGGIKPFKVAVGEFTVRDAFSGDLLSFPSEVVNNPADRDDDARRLRLARYVAERGLKEIDVLMETNDGLNVTGSHLGGVMKSVDELMNPCIHFTLKGVGVNLFGELTSRFSPDGQFNRQLGIVLDNELLSAPNIQEPIRERGRITGKFTDEEVQFLVNILQAGSLPVVLNKNPISASLINPLLGKETIEQGRNAMILGTVLVFLFMLVYYRFSGFLACIALALNILFTVALMVLIKAPLTLPGLAGLVLTVGMSVDANVLIYERIREEIARGAALRMALRNGFARATTTIVDSNLTTILTALILYFIGTDQLRGFAVLLILGLLTSMFTAIFCSRVFFDVVERNRFLTTLKMFQFLPVTKIDFVAYRRWAVGGSLVVLLIGLAASVVRGRDLLDIDFTGGSSVHMMLEKPAETEDVRKLLGAKLDSLKIPYSLTGMSMVPGQTTNKIFKVDAKIEQVDELEKIIREAFQQAGSDIKLATYSLTHSELRETVVTSPAESSAEKPSADPGRGEPPSANKSATEKAATEKAGAEKVGTDTKAPPAEKNDESSSAETKSPTEEKKSVPPSAKTEDPSKDKSSEAKSKEAAEPKAPDGAATELPAGNIFALARFALQAEDQQKTPAAAEVKTEAQAKVEPEKSPVTEPKKTDDEKIAEKKNADEQKTTEEKTGADEKKTETSPATSPATQPTPPAAASTSPASTTAAPATPSTTTLVETQLTFGHEINAATLRAEVEQTAQDLGIPLSYFDLTNPKWDGIGSNSYKDWTLRLSLSKENSQKILDRLQERFANEPVWPSSSTIGPTVAGRMQRTAVMALVASWLAIIVYVWLRFQSLVFGLAAVVALVHDVLVTVAALAVSYWLAGPFKFLLIEDFKISLTIVAALLTIIGYSINDTIVIFDRIREVRGKSPEITANMVNLSVNQTLGRTILTFFTVFIVVVCLYALGGQGIHGFAFAMLIGLLSGTYSTVFIATPFVLWLAGTPMQQAAPKSVTEKSLR